MGSSVNSSGFLTGFKPRARGAVSQKKVRKGPPSSGGMGMAMDSSVRVVDAEKVGHVLEVLGMSAGDHQSVSVLFRGFEMEIQTLMSVNGRWFVCLDDERLAMKALNVVKHQRFELRRIDCNARDVQMLKNNVPPPLRRKERQQAPPQQQQQNQYGNRRQQQQQY